jgi:ElaA protein
MQIKCFPITSADDMDRAHALRAEVFTGEQNVDPAVERDGQDAAARHFGVTIREGEGRETFVGTCRVRLMGSAAKIERVAVDSGYRKLGIGRVLMRYIINEFSKSGEIRLFKLAAQSFAVPFYEKLGFKTRGGEYIEAGMPHYDMVLEK